uniref:Adenosine kinase n=1 Tax=Timema shepardi TaxID=629360 RepID=A0A7R9ARM8_TIMSH|nr:unnamed protein product [Timema shepardi]
MAQKMIDCGIVKIKMAQKMIDCGIVKIKMAQNNQTDTDSGRGGGSDGPNSMVVAKVVDLTTQAQWMSLFFVTDGAEFPPSTLGAVERPFLQPSRSKNATTKLPECQAMLFIWETQSRFLCDQVKSMSPSMTICIKNKALYTCDQVTVFLLCHEVYLNAGGSAQNTARIFQWLVGPQQCCVYFGSIGSDEEGTLVETLLRRSGVHTRYTSHRNLPTGRCLALVHGEHRSLVANIGAARIYAPHHLNTQDNLKVLSQVKIIYIEGFFIANNFLTAKELIHFCQAKSIMFIESGGRGAFVLKKAKKCEIQGKEKIILLQTHFKNGMKQTNLILVYRPNASQNSLEVSGLNLAPLDL